MYCIARFLRNAYTLYIIQIGNMKICAAGQELNNVSFVLEMIDRIGKCVWQKSEDRFQIKHVLQLVITQLSVYASKLLKRKVYPNLLEKNGRSTSVKYFLARTD